MGDNISTAQELLGDLVKVPLHSYAEWGPAPEVLPVGVEIFPEQEQFRYFYVVSGDGTVEGSFALSVRDVWVKRLPAQEYFCYVYLVVEDGPVEGRFPVTVRDVGVEGFPARRCQLLGGGYVGSCRHGAGFLAVGGR